MATTDESRMTGRRRTRPVFALSFAVVLTGIVGATAWYALVVRPAQRGQSTATVDPANLHGTRFDAPIAATRPIAAPVASPETRPVVATSSASDDSSGSGQKALDRASAAASEAPDPGANATRRRGDTQYRAIGFKLLSSFDYDPLTVADALATEPDKPLPDQIPARIHVLDGARVAITGYMVPAELRRERVRSFLLVKNQLVCCFGAAVNMNDWVMVDMPDERGASYVPDVLITVFGELSVGEKLEDGMVMSIYRMKGDDVEYKAGF